MNKNESNETTSSIPFTSALIQAINPRSDKSVRRDTYGISLYSFIKVSAKCCALAFESQCFIWGHPIFTYCNAPNERPEIFYTNDRRSVICEPFSESTDGLSALSPDFAGRGLTDHLYSLAASGKNFTVMYRVESDIRAHILLSCSSEPRCRN